MARPIIIIIIIVKQSVTGEAELKIKGKRIQIRQLLRDFLRLAALRVIGPDALASPERQGYHSAQSI